MAFELQILSLKCISNQEADGDEIYLNVDGSTVYGVGVLRMSSRADMPNTISEVDFETGQHLTGGGWEPMPNFEPGKFRFTVEDSALIQLRERDLLLGDDLFGEAHIHRADAEGGVIQLAFTAEGAHYLLRYRVTRA